MLKFTIINPIFGYLFESIGALGNLRFLDPGLKITGKAGLRDFS